MDEAQRRNGGGHMDCENAIKLLAEIVRESKRIVFFGGAGVSTESGIPDFRSADGIYHKDLGKTFRPEEMVSRSFFLQHIREFYDFYKGHLIYPSAMPNAAHKVLAKWEEQGRLLSIVTQNIDGLHQAAGSKRVWELHGSVKRNFCISCHAFYDENFILESESVPTCKECGGIVKPDVVLYEEGLDENILMNAIGDIRSADVLMIGGTSLAVNPAAALIRYFRGKHMILINKGETYADEHADLVIHAPIGEVLQRVYLRQFPPK